MRVPQKKYREIVFQMLYSLDMSEVDGVDVAELLQKELKVETESIKLALLRAERIQQKFPDIDRLISENSLEFQFDRIQTVERNILRLALFEMLYDDEIPTVVAIAEAIRLTRKFSTPEAGSFVNAVLDAIKDKDETL